MEVNEFIFSRMSSDKKKELVLQCNKAELLSVGENTVLRIIKEVGARRVKSRDKDLYICGKFRVGNNSNSNFVGACAIKDRVYLTFYVQYAKKDTFQNVRCRSFCGSGEFVGEVGEWDYLGRCTYHCYRYDEDAKADCIRSLLLTYIHEKYLI